MQVESIYNHVPRAPPPPRARTTGKSRVGRRKSPVPLVASTFTPLGEGQVRSTFVPGDGRRAAATFGAKEHVMDTSAFLVAGSRTASTLGSLGRTEVAPAAKHKAKRLPPVVPRHDAPIMGIKTHANFVRQNTLDASLRQAPAEKVLTWEERLPFTHASQGRPPQYLESHRREREERAAARTAAAHAAAAGGDPAAAFDRLERLPEEERQDLIYGLKTRWDALTIRYQKLEIHGMALEGPRRREKEAVENELAVLEGMIEKLSQPGEVHVAGL